MKQIRIWIMATVLLTSSFAMASAYETVLTPMSMHAKKHAKHKKFKAQKSLNSKIHKKPKDPSYR